MSQKRSAKGWIKWRGRYSCFSVSQLHGTWTL